MNQSPAPPLFLGEKTVERCLDMRACIDAVEGAFRDASSLGPESKGVLGIPVEGGGFHIKAALAPSGFFAVKLNANFPGNPKRHGLPTIQGLLILADAGNGRPLALMHSGAVTRIRTAAATAVAIRHLAVRNGRAAALIGCGAQALDQLRALHAERPDMVIRLFDTDRAAADSLALRAASQLGIQVIVATSLEAACRGADLIVTCTPSRVPFLHPGRAGPGSLVVAVGADHPEKNEIEPALLAQSVIITDVTEQCAAFGDLHHALAAGAVTRADVRAEMGQVVAGQIAGRQHDGERIVFDSTGTPVQDVAAAELAWRHAVASGDGCPLAFDD